MGIADIFRRRRAPGSRLAPFAAAEAPAADPWSLFDGQPLEALGAAARRDVEASLALRAIRSGAPRTLEASPRPPEASPPGPRRAAFAADAARRPRLGPVSDARSLTPPWSAVCQIETRFQGGRVYGAGCRIGPHLVLTAAHMLLRPDLGAAQSVGLYFHNGADQPLRALSFEVAREWRARVDKAEERASVLGRDDYGVVFTVGDAPESDAYPYMPIHAVDQRWFAGRPAARYRLIGAPAGADAELEAHRLYEATDFAWAGLSPRLREALNWGPARGGARRFLHSCVRHRITAPQGFSGAPLLAAIPDWRTDSYYEVAVGVHLGAAEGFGAARIIDEEMKRRLHLWSRQARRMIETGA